MTGPIYTDAVPDGATPLQQQALQRLLNLGIHFRVACCDAAVTIDDCRAVGRDLGVTLIKNLLVSNRQKTRLHLVTMPGDKPFVTRAFTAGRGVSRVSFVSPDTLMQILATPLGGVGPLSLLHDADNTVEMVVDTDLNPDSQVAVPVLSPSMYAAVRLRDLTEIFLPDTGHEPVFITMENPAD